MEIKELNLNKECIASGSGGGNGKSGGDGFIDRSKVRILLCDNDTKNSEEVLSLLAKCSYQGIFCYLRIVLYVCFNFLCFGLNDGLLLLLYVECWLLDNVIVYRLKCWRFFFSK